MKFKEGQIVKHKLSGERFVIIKYLPVRWYRSRPKYGVIINEKYVDLVKKDIDGYIIVYESEIESTDKQEEDDEHKD